LDNYDIIGGFRNDCFFINSFTLDMAKLLYSKPFLVFLVIILILVVIVLGQESYHYFRTSQQIKGLKNKIEELKTSNEELAGLEEYFKSEEFLEKEARLKLNLTKPGEKLIIIKQIEEDLEEFEQEQGLAKEISNIQKWWQYFFGEKL